MGEMGGQDWAKAMGLGRMGMDWDWAGRYCEKGEEGGMRGQHAAIGLLKCVFVGEKGDSLESDALCR